MNQLLSIAEAILQRPLQASDSLAIADIEQAEARLGVQLPAVLRQFYQHLGGNQLFTHGHQDLANLEDLRIEAGLLIFMYEHQGVVWWAMRQEDLGQDDPEVFQLAPDNLTEIYSEQKNLSHFLEIILYYQAAQAAEGGYPYCGWLYDYQAMLPQIEAEWHKVVDDNGLHIWWLPGQLILKLDAGDDWDFLTLSTLSQSLLDQAVARYGFEPDQG